MRFALTEDQVAFRDAVRKLLATDCPWERLADMGLPGVLVAEQDGGLGLDETDLVPLLIETGYVAYPFPVVETVVAAPVILSGHKLVAFVGTTGLVPYGQKADIYLAIRDSGVWVIPPGGTPAPTVDDSRAAVRVDARGDLLTDDPTVVALARERVTLGHAAQLIGLARRMLDMTVEHVTSRRQFGVPVGSFQAVKHHLADALLRVEFAAPAVLAAGWALAHRTETSTRDVSIAAVLATEAAQEVAKTAIQCHGAIGYTVEYDLHRYAKRTWAVAAGVDLDFHIGRIAEVVLA